MRHKFLSAIAAVLLAAPASFAAQDSGLAGSAAYDPLCETGKWCFFRVMPDGSTPVTVIANTGGGGAVTQGTTPWVTNDPGLPDTTGIKTAALSTSFAPASDANIARETGGNLATIKTDLDSILTNTTGLATAAAQTTGNTNTGNTATSAAAIATATGAQADAAYTSGSGSLISLLKGLFGNTANNATAANQTTANSSLSTIATNTGTVATAAGAPADSAYAGSGSGSIIAILKGLFTNTTGLATAANQSTSATTLSTVATNTGNTATAAGTTADSAYAGSGSASIISILKGIYAKVAGSLTALIDGVTDAANTSCTGAAAGTLTCTPIAGPIPTAGYAVVQVNITAFSATSVTPQAFFDGGTTPATTSKCRVLSSANTIDLTSLVATGVYECVAGDHFQLTQVGAGAVTAKIALKRSAFGVGTGQTWSSGTTNTTAGLQVGGHDGSVFRRFLTDTLGDLGVYINGYSSCRFTTSTTTTCKSGAGVVHTLVINTRGATSTISCYDNTAASGTSIAIVDTTLSTTAFAYDINFTTGLTCITAGTTPGDITISYK